MKLDRRSVLALSLTAALPGRSFAQAYPSKPARIIVAYAAGGATDSTARQLAFGLTEKFGQQFIVDNRPGGSTQIAAHAVASSRADGYTLGLFDPSTVTINQTLFSKLSYDPSKFVPVAKLTNISNLILVNNDFPAKNLKEFVDYAKKNPGLRFGHSGTGNPSHLAMEQFNHRAQLGLVPVPYRGSALVLPDLISGQIPCSLTDTPSAIPYVTTGKVRALAITTARRSALLPDVPTIAESGYPGFDAASWYGVFAPVGTPNEVVQTLSRAIREVVTGAKMRAWIESVSLEVDATSAEDLAKLVKEDTQAYKTILERINLKLD